ncbi:pyridoxamine 5'-phosphate oxidase family protein [Pseudovibrio brasiliensis]|uniref:Pyridoxamine 5'-phosphate oxidase family protein n=1 Tax=Pseudovibrio brasiliensis TaxID=1898042 RepID=A0ABX8AZS8_9HYPH|nr:pyridoxamine 5'-phosphate oxidase family protein [Pseudovibrio brasiliensis]QUS58781.1 pyridoxamine 5'-phosphate oxidase family protein [Pseudovibrio brasiliensis]
MYSSDIAFTPTVKAIQSRKGSRHGYASMEERGGWKTEVTDDLAQYIAAQRSFFLATSNANGQPYIQHRGGPMGFLKVLDNRRLGFADFRGNRQYISQGNLEDNSKAFIFLIDYLQKTRIKIWGTAKVIEDDPELIEQLMEYDQPYRAAPEQAIIFTIDAWDANCPQHIPVRVDAEWVRSALEEKEQKIAELEAQIQKLQSAVQPS